MSVARETCQHVGILLQHPNRDTPPSQTADDSQRPIIRAHHQRGAAARLVVRVAWQRFFDLRNYSHILTGIMSLTALLYFAPACGWRSLHRQQISSVDRSSTQQERQGSASRVPTSQNLCRATDNHQRSVSEKAIWAREMNTSRYRPCIRSPSAGDRRDVH